MDLYNDNSMVTKRPLCRGVPRYMALNPALRLAERIGDFALTDMLSVCHSKSRARSSACGELKVSSGCQARFRVCERSFVGTESKRS